MNTIDCIKSRRSVRKFTEEKVPHEVLEQLVELSRSAPSWKNTQIARYVAVEDEALKNRIAEDLHFGTGLRRTGRYRERLNALLQRGRTRCSG